MATEEFDDFGYVPLTNQSADHHLKQVRRRNLQDELFVNRRGIFRIPIIIISGDKKLLIRDMGTVREPSKNACRTFPVARYDRVRNRDNFCGLVSGYFRRNLFPSIKGTRVDGTIGALGVYKSYTSDGSDITLDIKSVLAVVDHNNPFDQLHVTSDYRFFRGNTIWVEPMEAFTLFAEQADEIPDNKLAIESLALINIFQQGRNLVDVAHS